MKRVRYYGKTAMRHAFEQSDYPVKGRAGLYTTKGWRVIRRKKKRRRSKRERKTV